MLLDDREVFAWTNSPSSCLEKSGHRVRSGGRRRSWCLIPGNACLPTDDTRTCRSQRGRRRRNVLEWVGCEGWRRGMRVFDCDFPLARPRSHHLSWRRPRKVQKQISVQPPACVTKKLDQEIVNHGRAPRPRSPSSSSWSFSSEKGVMALGRVAALVALLLGGLETSCNASTDERRRRCLNHSHGCCPS
jgi:hypothetical protein